MKHCSLGNTSAVYRIVAKSDRRLGCCASPWPLCHPISDVGPVAGVYGRHGTAGRRAGPDRAYTVLLRMVSPAHPVRQYGITDGLFFVWYVWHSSEFLDRRRGRWSARRLFGLELLLSVPFWGRPHCLRVAHGSGRRVRPGQGRCSGSSSL